MMCGERKLGKNSEFQMGFEPTTFRTLVGRSNCQTFSKISARESCEVICQQGGKPKSETHKLLYNAWPTPEFYGEHKTHD